MAEVDFSRRAELVEEIDGPCSYEELRDCLRDLALVNRIVVAHRPTMKWLERVADRRVHRRSGPLRVVDVGCGYGDLLRRVERWARRRSLAVELVGIDLNANAVRAARQATPPGSRIEWIAGDASTCVEVARADVVITTAMMHHLTETEIVGMLQWMERTAAVGWMVSDLHRQAVPYYVFDLMMRGPWWHRFIRPDGLASIRRSFVPADWRRMCAAAGLDGVAKIAEYRPARLCVERLK